MNKQPAIDDYIVPASVDTNGVFRFYNPDFLMFPMKVILQASNAEHLKLAVVQFLTGKVKHKLLVVGLRAYIEYLPYRLSHVQLRDDNYEIVRYCKQHNIVVPSNISVAFKRS